MNSRGGLRTTVSRQVQKSRAAHCNEVRPVFERLRAIRAAQLSEDLGRRRRETESNVGNTNAPPAARRSSASGSNERLWSSSAVTGTVPAWLRRSVHGLGKVRMPSSLDNSKHEGDAEKLEQSRDRVGALLAGPPKHLLSMFMVSAEESAPTLGRASAPSEGERTTVEDEVERTAAAGAAGVVETGATVGSKRKKEDDDSSNVRCCEEACAVRSGKKRRKAGPVLVQSTLWPRAAGNRDVKSEFPAVPHDDTHAPTRDRTSALICTPLPQSALMHTAPPPSAQMLTSSGRPEEGSGAESTRETLRGQSVCIAGIKDPELADLCVLLSDLGAQYVPESLFDPLTCSIMLCRDVHAVVARSAAANGVPLVDTRWLVECRLRGRKLPCDSFLL